MTQMELLGLLSFSFTFLILIHCLSILSRRKLPPGPIGLPIIGNLFDIGPRPHESLARLAKKHGPLMTIRSGCITTIVASSPEMAKEILQKHDEAFSGRPIPDAVTSLKHYDQAVLWMSADEEWRIIRKALNTFLTHPQKLDTLRDLRHKAVQELVQHVKKASKEESAVEIGKLAFTTALNQMSNTCISVNVADYEDKDVKGFKSAVKTLMEVDGKFNIADIFPWLKPLDPQGLRRQAKISYDWFDSVSDGYIDKRSRHRECNLDKYGDMLDCLLDYSQENPSEFDRQHIKVLLVDLFLAGTETTSNTTEWAMTELLLNPRVMAKVRQEIKTNVRAKGRIEESEILKLPYLQAVIKETMRLHLSVPFLVPHKTEKKVELNGYTIPKNTQVLVNAWAMARDPDYWENPTCFMPERFLGCEVDFRGQHFSFIPFGSGRRMCPGIPLAQRVVSLTVASLVYHFDWKLPNGMLPENLDMNDIFGLTLQRAIPLLAVPTTLED